MDCELLSRDYILQIFFLHGDTLTKKLKYSLLLSLTISVRIALTKVRLSKAESGKRRASTTTKGSLCLEVFPELSWLDSSKTHLTHFSADDSFWLLIACLLSTMTTHRKRSVSEFEGQREHSLHLPA